MIGCVAQLVLLPAFASAHAALESSSPHLGARLAAVPHALKLVFDEDVVPQYARVAVVGAEGSDVAGLPRVRGSVVVVPLRGGEVGSYTVRWRMVASADGHATEGAFSFGVRVQPLPPAPVSALGVPVAPEVLAWLQFLGIVLAGGVLTFRALVWVPATRALGEHHGRDGTVVIWLAVAGAVIAVHAGVLSFLVGAYPIVGGGLSGFIHTEIEPIRVGTHLGQAWTLTTFAWFGVLALLVAAWVTPPKRERLLATAGVGALAIAFGLSWASHPASRGTLALVADYIHLVAAALWVGGLVMLAILAGTARSLPRPAREAAARASILRFSKLAVPTVTAVGLGGLYLALRELPSVSALFSSGYGVTLLVKSSVVAGALALGAYHRYFAVPRLVEGAPLGSIRRTLLVELSALLAVLVLAAILGQTAPPGS
jgi:copper transport protein